jgi:hypothetical protein
MNIPIISVVECEHAHTKPRTNTTRASLNLEPIAMFHDLLHLYLDVTSSGLRERKICTIRCFVVIFIFNHLVELLNKSVTAGGWRLFRIFLSKLSPHVLLQKLFHGESSEFQAGKRAGHGWVVTGVSRARVVSRNPFILSWEGLVRTHLVQHGSETESIICCSV